MLHPLSYNKNCLRSWPSLSRSLRSLRSFGGARHAGAYSLLASLARCARSLRSPCRALSLRSFALFCSQSSHACAPRSFPLRPLAFARVLCGHRHRATCFVVFRGSISAPSCLPSCPLLRCGAFGQPDAPFIMYSSPSRPASLFLHTNRPQASSPRAPRGFSFFAQTPLMPSRCLRWIAPLRFLVFSFRSK